MAADKNTMFLKHYTSIENLFKILDTGYLLLSNPEKWEDKNDYAGLRAFCRLKGEGIKARVLCFLDGEESIHHRNTFAKNGCSIIFDKDYILKQINTASFLHGPVEYIHDITAKDLRKLAENKPGKIPFLKRSLYECEREYRLIWFGTSEEAPKIKLQRKAIKHLILSPGLPDISREKLKDYLETRYKIEAVLSRALESKPLISKFNQLGKRR